MDLAASSSYVIVFHNQTGLTFMDRPRDLKIRYAFKMIDFDNDGKINTSDIQEYLTRITKLSQTKENVKAYKLARDQALQLDKAHEEEDDVTLIKQFSLKNDKEMDRHLRQLVCLCYCSFNELRWFDLPLLNCSLQPKTPVRPITNANWQKPSH